MIYNYYEVRYELYDAENKSLGKFSMPIAARGKNESFAKCAEKIGRHSFLYSHEISYQQYQDWKNSCPVS